MASVAGFAMAIGVGVGVGSQAAKAVYAEEEVYYTLTPASGSNNAYASSCDVVIDGITWNVTGNSTTDPWRIGGKSLNGVNRTVYSKTAMSSAITKVELKVGSASSITVNSLKLVAASNSGFSANVDEVSETFTANSTITFTPSSGENWATGSYYKFIFNVTVSGTSNKYVEFTEAKFYREKSGGDTPVTYTVTYDANGGTGSMTDPDSPYNSGSSVTVLDNEFTRDGYNFVNFNTAEDGSGSDYDEGDTFTISGNTTLYAQWAEQLPSAGSFTITGDDFVGTYDGGATKTHTSTVNGSTAKVSWESVNVMKNNGIQFKASGGNLYNTVDLGNIISVSISGTNALTVYYGTSEAPSSGTVPGTGNGFFKIVKTDSGAAIASSITVTWGAPILLNSISASLDTAAAAKEWFENDVLLASDIDVVTSYSDSSLNGTISDGSGVYFDSNYSQNTYTLSKGTNEITVYYKDANQRTASTSLTINNVAAAKTVQAWAITGSIGETVKSTEYDLSGLTLHAYYDLEKEDEASSAVAALYEMVANPSTAGATANPDNKIEIKVYLATDTNHENCLATFSNIPAPIIVAVRGSEENPYTVAQARQAIDSGTGITGVYATGIVSQIVTAYNSEHGNITYNISSDGLTTSDQLQAYRGKNKNGANFTSENDVQVGATVVVYGNLTKYGSTYEFAANNQLFSYQAPSAEAQINAYLSSATPTTMLHAKEHNTAGIDPESLVFADLSLENGNQYTDPFNGGHFTITFGSTNGSGKYYNDGSAIRVYNKASFTIESEAEITKIAFAWHASNKPSVNNVVDTGTYNSSTGVWTGSAYSITFTSPEGASQWRLQSLTVSYGDFDHVDSVSIEFGTTIPKTSWDAIEDNHTISEFGVMLFRTRLNSVPSVEEVYESTPAKVIAVNNLAYGVTLEEDGDNYSFSVKVNVSSTANYDIKFCAATYVVVDGTYHFLDEFQESVNSLAEYYKTHDGSGLSAAALNILAGN